MRAALAAGPAPARRRRCSRRSASWRPTSRPTRSLRSFLVHRVDTSSTAGHAAVGAAPAPGPAIGTGCRPPQADRLGRARDAGSRATSGSSGAASYAGARVAADSCRADHVPARPTDEPRDRVAYFTVPVARRRRAATASAPRSSRSSPERMLDRRELAHGVDSTLHRLLLIELLVTAAVLAALAALGALGRPARAAAAARDRGDRGRDRRRRPLAARRARRPADRGRPARQRAQRDARPDRGLRPARCAASSPTRRTSCGRRSPPCAPTRSSSSAAPPPSRRSRARR